MVDFAKLAEKGRRVCEDCPHSRNQHLQVMTDTFLDDGAINPGWHLEWWKCEVDGCACKAFRTAQDDNDVRQSERKTHLMAKNEARLSNKPSNAEKGGGNFGFPPGSIVTVDKCYYSTWGEAADERAVTKGRAAEDPCLVLEGTVENIDEPRKECLSAGKSSRAVPSRDGEFLAPAAEGSGATGLVQTTNAMRFLNSLCDKDTHGKRVFDEDQLDDVGVSSVNGLVFRAGKQTFKSDDPGMTPGPTLVVAEIISLPGEGGGKKSASKPVGKPGGKPGGKSDADDEKPAKPGKPAGGKSTAKSDFEIDVEGEAEEVAERAIKHILEENPKFRKGMIEDAAYPAAFQLLKGAPNADEVLAFLDPEQNPKWLTGRKRPWDVTEDGKLIAAED